MLARTCLASCCAWFAWLAGSHSSNTGLFCIWSTVCTEQVRSWLASGCAWWACWFCSNTDLSCIWFIVCTKQGRCWLASNCSWVDWLTCCYCINTITGFLMWSSILCMGCNECDSSTSLLTFGTTLLWLFVCLLSTRFFSLRFAQLKQ